MGEMPITCELCARLRLPDNMGVMALGVRTKVARKFLMTPGERRIGVTRTQLDIHPAAAQCTFNCAPQQ